jgi:hypothetical protein
LESDHDVDLLVEQEVIRALKMRKELRRMVHLNENKTEEEDKHEDDDQNPFDDDFDPINKSEDKTDGESKEK